MYRSHVRIDADAAADGLSPERVLIAAMLRCAVDDARSTATRSVFAAQRRATAQAWLRDRAQVQWWLDLVGLPEETYAQLLKAAGLGEA